MGFAINTNNDALNTYRNLSSTQASLSKSLEKLSSGLRINQAGDDAAGLTISTQLASQVSGLQQASRNAQDGTSLVQTADGALTQAQSILGRLRDLAVQAGNDSNSGTARTAIANEATSLTAELTRIGNSVNFNGTKLLAGATGAANIANIQFQVGAGAGSENQISVDLSKADLVKAAATLQSGNAGTSFTPASITGSMKFSSTVGSSTTTVSVSGLGTYSTAADAVAGLTANADFSSKFTASVYTPNGGTAAVLVSAKDGGTVGGETGTVTPASGNTPASTSYASTTGTNSVTGANPLAFATAAQAQASITAIDTQIAAISEARANIGAIENRFNNVVSTIATSVTNLTAAKSRITDVDMAQEMVSYTRASVLSQAGTAMLAQANSLPQLALKLLG